MDEYVFIKFLHGYAHGSGDDQIIKLFSVDNETDLRKELVDFVENEKYILKYFPNMENVAHSIEYIFTLDELLDIFKHLKDNNSEYNWTYVLFSKRNYSISDVIDKIVDLRSG